MPCRWSRGRVDNTAAIAAGGAHRERRRRFARPGHRGAGRHGVRRGLVEVTVGQLAHGGEHLRRLRAEGLDQDLVILLDAEVRDAVQASRAGRAAAP